jgi:ankyrin repeat protein
MYRLGACSHVQFVQTALICAAENGHIDCVRLLVEAGADMDVQGVRIGPVDLNPRIL